MHLWPFIKEAQARGARVVTIDPYRSRTAEQADGYLLIRPGTDAALALGDDARDLPRRAGATTTTWRSHTLGCEPLRRARRRVPARAGGGRSPGCRPRRSSDWRATTRTTQPAAIRLNYGLQRHARRRHGGAHDRLPAGAGRRLARPGRRASCSRPAAASRYDLRALERPDLIPRRHAHDQHGPARRGAGPSADAAGQGAVRLQLEPGRGRARTRRACSRGLRRDDLFTVVHEQFQTDTADYADIVLPATTHLEHFDVHKAYGHLYVQSTEPAIAPLGEAKPNTEVFRLLAARMGFDEPCFARQRRGAGRGRR